LFDAIRLVVIVTPAASVSFFRSEFNDFLYALIGADRNEMPVTVLSALARLDLDPWEEAAQLSELPTNTATQRLATLLGRLPGGRWAQDSLAIADRLIELLPRRRSSKEPLPQKADGLREMANSTVAMLLICAALGITALIFAASREPSPQGDHADPPASSRASPPQTSPASSR
jgi:hypothetical protein